MTGGFLKCGGCSKYPCECEKGMDERAFYARIDELMDRLENFKDTCVRFESHRDFKDTEALNRALRRIMELEEK